jgi:hypothetical protein
VIIAAGASGESSLSDPVSFGVEPFLEGTYSLTAPITDAASGLIDAAARLGYGLPGQGFTWFGYAAADLSWRGERLFALVGASAEGEGDATGSLPSLRAATDIELSLDLSRSTLSFAPALRWWGGDELGLGADGKISAIIPAGDAAVLRASVRGGMEWPAEGMPVWFAGGELGASLYPAPPLVVALEAGLLRRVSSNSAEVDADGVAVTVPNEDSYLETTAGAEITATLGRGISLGMSVPISLRLADHGAVRGGVVVAEDEWLVAAGPALTVRVELSRSFTLTAALAGDLSFSNSLYLEERVLTITLEAALSF